MVTNKCCCICFTDEKDFLDITLDPGGPAGHPWESEGSNQKLVGFKNVANNSCQVASEQVLCIQFKYVFSYWHELCSPFQKLHNCNTSSETELQEPRRGKISRVLRFFGTHFSIGAIRRLGSEFVRNIVRIIEEIDDEDKDDDYDFSDL